MVKKPINPYMTVIEKIKIFLKPTKILLNKTEN